jgi:hypothetical protein
MHQQRIGIAAHAERKRLPGADRDDVHIQPAGLLEDREDVPEQAGILGRSGGTERDELVLRVNRAGEEKRQDEGADLDHGFPSAGSCPVEETMALDLKLDDAIERSLTAQYTIRLVAHAIVRQPAFAGRHMADQAMLRSISGK